jgi:transposase InsO family protein
VVKKKKRKSGRTPHDVPKSHGPVPYPVRIRIVQAVMRGATQADAAVAFGVSMAVVHKFLALFRAGGVEALRDLPTDRQIAARKNRRKHPEREAVLALKDANPDWGARRISDVLARFQGLGISYSTAHRILREAGLIATSEESTARDKPVRRFERAEPNQLWQSDIFTFELRRHERVYIVGFMDDYSRYLVSWAMAHHQKSSLVIEALQRGIAEYGQPKEVLTDQGRQYAAWRGTTEFQELLRRHGIEHIKSRPQHPETLGKIERFWKTLWNDFLRKTVFADFADALRRIELFVKHYNFQRPHQALDGLVPADRFFRAAPQVRAAVEAQVQANALRLAQEKPIQKPFYLVGRLGDQDLSIAASGGALRVQVGDAAQTIPMTKEDDDEVKATRAFPEDETIVSDGAGDRAALRPTAPALASQLREARAANQSAEEMNDAAQSNGELVDAGQAASSTNGTQTWRAAVAERSHRSGSGRSASHADDLVSALGADPGDDGDRRARDFAAALLPARDEGCRRDDASAGTWSERCIESRGRDTDASDRGARDEDCEARAGEPSPGAPLAAGEEGAASWTDRDAGETGSEIPTLDERWTRTFAWLEEAGDSDDDVAEPDDFDPDDGWRERAMRWNRKLAGADAPIDGDHHGESPGPERTIDLREPTRRTAGAEAALRLDSGSDRRADDDQRCGEGARHSASEHADAGPPRGSGDHRSAAASTDWTDADGGLGEAALRARRTAGEEERQTPQAADGSGRHDDGGRRDHPQPARPAAGVLEDIVIALEALAAETAEQQRRRLGAGTTDASSAASGAGASEDEPL